MYYTIGQRKGLNVSYSEPLYVVSLDVINTLKTLKEKNINSKNSFGKYWINSYIC